MAHEKGKKVLLEFEAYQDVKEFVCVGDRRGGGIGYRNSPKFNDRNELWDKSVEIYSLVHPRVHPTGVIEGDNGVLYIIVEVTEGKVLFVFGCFYPFVFIHVCIDLIKKYI